MLWHTVTTKAAEKALLLATLVAEYELSSVAKL